MMCGGSNIIGPLTRLRFAILTDDFRRQHCDHVAANLGEAAFNAQSFRVRAILIRSSPLPSRPTRAAHLAALQVRRRSWEEVPCRPVHREWPSRE